MEISVTETFEPSDVTAVYELYESAWPNDDRTVTEVESIVRGSDIAMAAYDDSSGKLVGFARVLTDFTAKALICDIVVEKASRGTGVGGRLVEAARDHPRLADVDTVELYCRPGLVEFYRQYGFTDDVEMGLMRLTSERA